MFGKTWSLTIREIRHFYRSRMEIVILLTVPIIMLILFGQEFNQIGSSGDPTGLSGAPDYVSFMSIGILALTVMMTCMYGSISIVMDHQSGFLKKLITSPVNRASIAMSRIWSSIIKSIIVSISILGFALVLTAIPGLDGLSLKSSFSLLDLLGIILVLFLTSCIFSSLIVMISMAVDKVETMAGLINLFNLPFMFISTILLPTVLMPGWLRVMADMNPLTWASDAMRQFAFVDSALINDLWTNLLLLVIFAVVSIALCAAASRKLLCKD